MKKILVFLFALALSLPGKAQLLELEGAIEKKFEALYPGATELESVRQLESGYTVVNFTYSGEYRYVLMKNNNGAWKEQGVAFDFEKVPDTVKDAVPEMEMTAFLYECFKAYTFKDQKGYLLIYETDIKRTDLFISEGGEIIRNDEYPIPKELEFTEEESSESEEDGW